MTNPLTTVQVGTTTALSTEDPAQLQRKSAEVWEVQRLVDGAWVTAAIIEHHVGDRLPWEIYPPDGTRSEDGEDKPDEKSALDAALDFHIG